MSRQTEQLEHQAETARVELASSLDALREKLTPREIVDETMDYVRDTRVGHFARNLSRDVQKNTFPLLVVFAGIAGTCIAAALRSQRKLACRESANAMMSGPASAGQPEQFVAHEGWGVEKIREPLG